MATLRSSSKSLTSGGAMTLPRGTNAGARARGDCCGDVENGCHSPVGDSMYPCDGGGGGGGVYAVGLLHGFVAV